MNLWDVHTYCHHPCVCRWFTFSMHIVVIIPSLWLGFASLIVSIVPIQWLRPRQAPEASPEELLRITAMSMSLGGSWRLVSQLHRWGVDFGGAIQSRQGWWWWGGGGGLTRMSKHSVLRSYSLTVLRSYGLTCVCVFVCLCVCVAPLRCIVYNTGGDRRAFKGLDIDWESVLPTWQSRQWRFAQFSGSRSLPYFCQVGLLPWGISSTWAPASCWQSLVLAPSCWLAMSWLSPPWAHQRLHWMRLLCWQVHPQKPPSHLHQHRSGVDWGIPIPQTPQGLFFWILR